MRLDNVVDGTGWLSPDGPSLPSQAAAQTEVCTEAMQSTPAASPHAQIRPRRWSARSARTIGEDERRGRTPRTNADDERRRRTPTTRSPSGRCTSACECRSVRTGSTPCRAGRPRSCRRPSCGLVRPRRWSRRRRCCPRHGVLVRHMQCDVTPVDHLLRHREALLLRLRRIVRRKQPSRPGPPAPALRLSECLRATQARRQQPVEVAGGPRSAQPRDRVAWSSACRIPGRYTRGRAGRQQADLPRDRP